ncbi:MAG: glycosyltransferase family 2 protein, partial [Chloroflexota bacterium]
VFNERKTFSQVMELLVQKEIDGLEMEIVVVESNSTDGTREEVLKYKDHPKVKLILEDKPQGKGHAVRTGLAHAAGDFILIQDADLEYDLNDYEELLAPLRAGTSAFVLGSRHGQPTGYNRTANRSAWKIRHFIDQPEMGLLLNFGHIFFTTALNVLYGQRTKDPFTMYKVFRRDCLFGLNFECNRFDFDFELVIKLWRKGYKALEIPVSYNSRSFNEGKKVTIFRDPLTWLRALARFRVQPLNLVKNVREANLAELASDRSGEEISEILTAVFLDSEIEWEV